MASQLKRLCRHLCFVVLGASAGCQHMPGPLAGSTSGSSRIAITAEAGSEVVINKYGGGQPVPPQPSAEVSEMLLHPLDRIDDPLPLDEPGPFAPPARIEALQPRETPASDLFAPLPRPAPRPEPLPMVLGEIKAKVWSLRRGEPLVEAIDRLRKDTGYALSAAEGLPNWVITEPAEYRGEFRDMLAWLVSGFAHTEPRPIITLHPNNLLRLEAE